VGHPVPPTSTSIKYEFCPHSIYVFVWFSEETEIIIYIPVIGFILPRRRVFYNVRNETLHVIYIPSHQRVSLVHPKCYQRTHDYRWKFWTPVRLIVWLLLICYIRMVWDIFGCEPHVCDAYSARHWRCAKHLLRCHVACFGLDIFIQIGKRYCAALSRHWQCSSPLYRR